MSEWRKPKYYPGGGGEVLPYMGYIGMYIGMCGAKGYGFSAALVINSHFAAILVKLKLSV